MADLRNTRLSVYLRTRLLNAAGMADFDGALIRIYTGAQPATPETAIGAQVLLVTPELSTPGFPAGGAVAGVATANPIVAKLAVAAGTALWARILNAAATQVLADISVGPAGDGNIYNLTLPTNVLVIGMSIGSTGLTLTLPMQGL